MSDTFIKINIGGIVKNLLVISIAMILAACGSTLAEAEKEEPHADFMSMKNIDEYSNCVAMELGLHHDYTEARLPDEGKRYYRGGWGAMGFYIDMIPVENKTHVKAWIPSSGWALIPKRTLKLVNDCK